MASIIGASAHTCSHTEIIALLQLPLVRTSTKRNIWVLNSIKSEQDYVEMYYGDPVLRSTIKTSIFAEVIRFYALVKGGYHAGC